MKRWEHDGSQTRAPSSASEVADLETRDVNFDLLSENNATEQSWPEYHHPGAIVTNSEVDRGSAITSVGENTICHSTSAEERGQ